MEKFKGCLKTIGCLGVIIFIALMIIGIFIDPPEHERHAIEEKSEEKLKEELEEELQTETSDTIQKNDSNDIFKRKTIRQGDYLPDSERILSGRPASADQLPYENSANFLAKHLEKPDSLTNFLFGKRMTVHGRHIGGGNICIIGKTNSFNLHLYFRNPRNRSLVTADQGDYVMVEGVCDIIKEPTGSGGTGYAYFLDSKIIKNYGSIWDQKENNNE